MREEVELKFPLANVTLTRRLLRQAGFRIAKTRRFESNWIFDSAGSSLRRQGKLLRLRKSGTSWLLTVKGERRPGPFKRREERETVLADGASCRHLLELLGYREVMCYQRHRTTFAHPQQPGEVALDETPMGWYLEIEGKPAWIRRTAAALGLKLATAEPRSYPELYQTRPTAPPARGLS